VDGEIPELSESSRAARLARRRNGGRKRALIGVSVAGGLALAAIGAYAFVWSQLDSSSARTTSAPIVDPGATVRRTPQTHKPTTTTTTIPPIKQPASVTMPSPGGGLGYGAKNLAVLAYERRMKDLHFDPGPVDGLFDQDTQYAVIAVQKYFGQPRTGVIDAGVQLALSKFKYASAEPDSEADRVEIDLDRQVLTTFQNWQPILIATTSTGSGEHFCGGVDGCQYAITQTGHFHFYSFYNGWDDGKLGKMWNPYYFNGGEAVHGLESVPAYPASHGCARIPMHIANYFHTLVHMGESVFVVGTPKKAGSQYVGPVKTPPPAPTTVPPTAPPAPTTVKAPPTTKPSPPTTKHTPPTTAAKK
jgi:peptidoglycan hydrolase-like protein with peptidoglycan-binding domain